MNPYRLIQSSELKEFRMILQKNGYNTDDFHISENEFTKNLQQGAVHPLKGLVMVRDTRAGVMRYYKVGQGFNWVTEFSLDLREGRFRRLW